MVDEAKLQAILDERGRVYGPKFESHVNIGLSWTGLIQQHYGLSLPAPIPASLVMQMLVILKMQRAARVFHDDNYDDAVNYAEMARDAQRQEGEA